ncbi:VWA domain-containing protein [Hyphomicrobium sp. xq]|uniref:VWA domain-containing protein n=1 Tax=Hyphomicrobium album TaxID=2665159 RepID=A0A6I3KRF6_9HYPH|nr:VWA domain-containing protein [Hyphomicrobium album]MTD96227.1 VWA domain-containing protein [Hyphomicrobium album]
MPPLSRMFAGCLVAAVVALACAGAEGQDAPPTTMIVLDGSGSMWGNLGTEKLSKLEMARAALRALLPSLRTDARIGIASFGHRRRGNCGDAEVILPPDINGPERLTQPVEKLNAMGKGPLVLALRESAQAIAGATPASIVLVADDLDNCGQDVCTALGDILATNPNLVVHTVAIGFDKPKLDHISCIPRQTGGKLWDAQDAVGFNSAIGQAVKLALLQSGPTAPAPEPAQAEAQKPAAGAPPGLYLSAGLGPTSATLDTPVHWRITKSGADGQPVRDTRAAAVFEKLEPGSYDIEADVGLARARQTVDVAADQAVQVRVDLNAGVLKMQARSTTAAPPLTSPVFTVSPAKADAGDAPIWVGRDTQPEILLPAGDYVVTAQNGLARQQTSVTIGAATGTSFNSMLASGTLELSATRGTAAVPGDAVDDGVTFILHQDDPDAPQGRREVARSAAPAPSFMLPSGTYYVTARTATSEARDQLAIGAGDVVKRALPLSLAQVKLSATLGGQPPTGTAPVTYRIVRLGAEPHEIARTLAKDPEFELSAGQYRFEASLGGSNVIAAVDLALGAGQTQKVNLPLQGGSLTLKRTDTGAPGDIFWEVRDEKQKTVLRSSQPQPTAVLAPGRYAVSSETSTPLMSSIEVKANEHRTFDFTGQ